MKNLLRHSLLFAVMLISTAAFADEVITSIKVKENNNKALVFYLDALQKVSLSIYSLNDGLIYEQNIQSEKPLTKIYNLEAFPDGTYIVKLANAAKLIEYEVNIHKGKTLISEAVVTEYFKPTLTKEQRLVTLDLKTVPYGPVEIKVLNEYNEVLYAKSFPSKIRAAKKFNIAGADARELTFIIIAKDQEFVETVSVN